MHINLALLWWEFFKTKVKSTNPIPSLVTHFVALKLQVTFARCESFRSTMFFRYWHGDVIFESLQQDTKSTTFFVCHGVHLHHDGFNLKQRMNKPTDFPHFTPSINIVFNLDREYCNHKYCYIIDNNNVINSDFQHGVIRSSSMVYEKDFRGIFSRPGDGNSSGFYSSGRKFAAVHAVF